MQTAPPTPPTPPSRGESAAGDAPRRRSAAAGGSRSSANSKRSGLQLYAAQLRAFLEAADVVDVDPEVIEDLVDGFPEDSLEDGDVDVEAEGHGEADEEEAGPRQRPDSLSDVRERERERGQVDAPGTSARGGDAGSESEDEVEVGDEQWAAYIEEAQTAWTKQEVKEMMVVLKEQGMSAFITEYVVRRAIPIPRLLYAFNVCLCPELRAKQRRTMMFLLRVALSRELESRERLLTYNTIDDAVRLIEGSRRILILTGAGISVSCGIPDFRSRNGLYASLQGNGEYDLDDPQQMSVQLSAAHARIGVFADRAEQVRHTILPGEPCGVLVSSRRVPKRLWANDHPLRSSFASKIYPSNFTPSPCHRFIKLIEDKGQLLRNYTQNIDTLETLAGVQRVVQCHGSFATASCIQCKVRVPGTEIADDIMNQRVPLCRACSAALPPGVSAKAGGKKGKKRKDGWDSDQSDEPDVPAYPPGIMKPDITFFGEKLDDVFERSLLEDRREVDLLIIIGTSLKVSPVSETISHLPHSVPQILINKTPVKHINPDVVLLGNADDIVLHLCGRLGWDLPEVPTGARNLDAPKPNFKKRPSAEFEREPRRVGTSHVWLFEGAEGGKWVEDVERRFSQSTLGLDSPSEGATASPQTTDERQMKKTRTV